MQRALLNLPFTIESLTYQYPSLRRSIVSVQLSQFEQQQTIFFLIKIYKNKKLYARYICNKQKKYGGASGNEGERRAIGMVRDSRLIERPECCEPIATSAESIAN